MVLGITLPFSFTVSLFFLHFPSFFISLFILSPSFSFFLYIFFPSSFSHTPSLFHYFTFICLFLCISLFFSLSRSISLDLPLSLALFLYFSLSLTISPSLSLSISPSITASLSQFPLYLSFLNSTLSLSFSVSSFYLKHKRSSRFLYILIEENS